MNNAYAIAALKAVSAEMPSDRALNSIVYLALHTLEQAQDEGRDPNEAEMDALLEQIKALRPES